jgi:hypothetical protein
MISMRMVPFYQVPGVNYDVLVNQWLVPSGIPIPDMLPENLAEYEHALGSPTWDAYSWIVNDVVRKKEEAQAAAVKKLKEQQKTLENQVTRLTKQYQDLTALYNKAVSSKESDAATIAILKMQLESVVEILASLGIKPSK